MGVGVGTQGVIENYLLINTSKGVFYVLHLQEKNNMFAL